MAEKKIITKNIKDKIKAKQNKIKIKDIKKKTK